MRPAPEILRVSYLEAEDYGDQKLQVGDCAMSVQR
jgi:hypothetical protein